MPRRILRWMSYRIGNRGVVLGSLGFIWFLAGIGMWASRVPIPTPEDYIPIWFRALVWAGPGAFAMISSLANRAGPTAWGLMMVAPFMRLAAFFTAFMFESLGRIFDWWDNGQQFHYPNVWLPILVWLAVVVMLDRSAAGLDRLPPPHRPWRNPHEGAV